MLWSDDFKITSHTSFQHLLVDENRENLAASGVVIDKESHTITLSSYDVGTTTATIYHTVYDFDGKCIVYNPLTINLKTQDAPAESSGGIYIWECQYCGEKRNATKKPSVFEFTCYGRGERPGFGNSHNWVKVGRMD